jgi:hypothetical protein
MFALRLTPRVVACGLAGELLLLVACYLPAAWGWTPRFRLAEAVVMTTSGVLAFGVMFVLSLEVAAEYRQSRWAQLAWWLLAANAALSLLKKIAGSLLIDFLVHDYRSNPLRGLLENALIVPANLCLLLGLMALWWALHRLGLGFKIERRDYLAMVGVAAVFLALLLIREDLSQGRSPYALSRVLQPLGLALLGVCSAFSVVLHRYAVQMGDGTLAVVMRWLMIYVVWRGVLVLGRGLLSPNLPVAIDAPSELEQWTYDVLWEVVHWAAAMATVYRAQLTVRAAEQLKRLRAAKAAMVPA